MANRLVGKDVYEWSVVSLDGAAERVEQRSEALADRARSISSVPVDILFVCGGINIREAVSPALLVGAAPRLADRRVPLGALCTGGYALARAGLLDNFRATIHWENLSALREEFPRVLISDQLFTIDRNRFTCSGGTAPLDLMLNLIEAQARVADLAARLGAIHRRSGPQGQGSAVHPVARPGGRVAPRPDPRRAAHGGEHREAAVAREDRQGHRAVAAANRAAVQARSELRAEALLSGDAPASRARAAAANRHAHHGHHGGVRLSVPAALLQVLPQSVRLSAQRGAQDRRGARPGSGSSAVSAVRCRWRRAAYGAGMRARDGRPAIFPRMRARGIGSAVGATSHRRALRRASVRRPSIVSLRAHACAAAGRASPRSFPIRQDPPSSAPDRA